MQSHPSAADNPEQSKRFIEAARKAEAAKTKEEADRAFRKVEATKAGRPK